MRREAKNGWILEKSVGNTSLVVDVLSHSERIPAPQCRAMSREQKAKMLEQNSQNNQGVVAALLENGRTKDSQINNMTNFLSQVQESLNKLNNEMDYHRLEDI